MWNYKKKESKFAKKSKSNGIKFKPITYDNYSAIEYTNVIMLYYSHLVQWFSTFSIWWTLKMNPQFFATPNYFYTDWYFKISWRFNDPQVENHCRSSRRKVDKVTWKKNKKTIIHLNLIEHLTSSRTRYRLTNQIN